MVQIAEAEMDIIRTRVASRRETGVRLNVTASVNRHNIANRSEQITASARRPTGENSVAAAEHVNDRVVSRMTCPWKRGSRATARSSPMTVPIWVEIAILNRRSQAFD